jgi:hypothetical protein
VDTDDAAPRLLAHSTVLPPLVILMPVFDDWMSVQLLLPLLESALREASLTARTAD